MEGLRGPIHSLIVGAGMNSECFEAEDTGNSSVLDMSHDPFMSHHQLPFLQMLQGAMQSDLKEENALQMEEEDQPQLQLYYPEALFSCYPTETHSQLLLRLQLQHHSKQQTAEMESSMAMLEPVDSCVTHASAPNPVETNAMPGESRKKRKRARARTAASKNAGEAESQRMTHIVVERNRRQLMNHHLASLRALMPPSFVKRGDQASIVGGAVEFVKELEQLLVSLQAEKLSRTAANAASASSCSSASSPCTALSRSNEDEASNAATNSPLEGFFVAPQYTSYSQSGQEWGVDVEAVVVQGHVSLKVAGRRRAGLLARAIAALEELRLSVLHLTATSLSPSAVLYSLNLKMEEQCKLGSPEEIATAVHHIFNYIDAC